MAKYEVGPVFKKALGKFESEAEFARQVGVKSRQLVLEWRKQMGYIPLKWAPAVAVATGIPLVEIVNETARMMRRREIEREVREQLAAANAAAQEPVEGGS